MASMKYLLRLSAAATLALQPCMANSFGNYFATGPVANGGYIASAESTLVIPDAPPNEQGLVNLWTGMETTDSDLIQAIASTFKPSNNPQDPCGDLNGNWCAQASTLQNGVQEYGTRNVVPPGTQATQKYVYNQSTGNYDQSVIVNGQTISTLSTNSGLAQGWGTAEECSVAVCGTVPAHSWVNTVITLNAPDPNYGNTVAKMGSTGTLTTPDGGLTWVVATIEIDAFTFTSA